MATSLTPLKTRAARGVSTPRPRVISASARSTIILGIDPGLERTGYGVIVAPQGRVLDAGLFRSSTKAPLPERLTELASGLEEVIAEHRPGLVAVEDLYAHYKHPRTAILMGHVRGVLLYLAAKNRIDVLNLPSTRVKRFLTGNGHASKDQMQRAIMTTLSLPRLPEPSDVADALAVAWCATSEIRKSNRS
ncbi:MAG TPA: crossover junction endodeoxyribonuclease RuvC [Phycisphaerae bacterium]|nr:crossover junction endodeoxyribonuclease RuvC [Phycisphaerae bacterium]